MSYVLRRSVSSWKVVVRWTHHCLTAPSRCSGHPTGIRESSNCPSPFCSMTVTNNGTSMVAFRLHCHVSDAKSLLAAISFRAAKLGCSRSGFSDGKAQAMHGIKGIGRSSCRRTGHSFIFEPCGAESSCSDLVW